MDIECQLELLNVCVHRVSSISNDPSVFLDDHSPWWRGAFLLPLIIEQTASFVVSIKHLYHAVVSIYTMASVVFSPPHTLLQRRDPIDKYIYCCCGANFLLLDDKPCCVTGGCTVNLYSDNKSLQQQRAKELGVVILFIHPVTLRWLRHRWWFN